MSERGEALLQAGILTGAGLFLYNKQSNGTLFFYIHQRFGLLTLLASFLFLTLGLAIAAQLTTQHSEGAHNHDSHRQDHDRRHIHRHHVPRSALILVALPAVLGTLIPPKPLGAQTLGNRELSVGKLTSAQRGRQSQLVDPAESGSILGWLLRFGEDPDPATFAGQEANVLGFVYRDGRFRDDQFMVARFAIFCCVADASAVGLIVRWPEAAALEADTWVQVKGRFEPDEFDGQTLPVLVAESVTLTEQPAQPYVYP